MTKSRVNENMLIRIAARSVSYIVPEIWCVLCILTVFSLFTIYGFWPLLYSLVPVLVYLLRIVSVSIHEPNQNSIGVSTHNAMGYIQFAYSVENQNRLLSFEIRSLSSIVLHPSDSFPDRRTPDKNRWNWPTITVMSSTLSTPKRFLSF